MAIVIVRYISGAIIIIIISERATELALNATVPGDVNKDWTPKDKDKDKDKDLTLKDKEKDQDQTLKARTRTRTRTRTYLV